VGVYGVRAFVRLREMMATNKAVAARPDALDRKVAGHDETSRALVQAIRQLMESPPPTPRRRSIGFRVEEAAPRYRIRRVRRAT
jgi:hypothetical protein